MPKKTTKTVKARVFEDERGAVLFPAFSAATLRRLKAGNLKEFHIATLKPGAVRGNHVHPHHEEYLICVGGDGEVLLRRKSGPIAVLRLRNETIKVPRGVAHAIVNRGADDLVVACFYGPSPKKLTRVREVLA